ncbi:unnamed protein product, partial [Mesorhabditis belari]
RDNGVNQHTNQYIKPPGPDDLDQMDTGEST